MENWSEIRNPDLQKRVVWRNLDAATARPGDHLPEQTSRREGSTVEVRPHTTATLLLRTGIPMATSKRRAFDATWLPFGLPIGLIIGISVGMVWFDSLVFGAVLGVILGLALGAAIGFRRGNGGEDERIEDALREEQLHEEQLRDEELRGEASQGKELRGGASGSGELRTEDPGSDPSPEDPAAGTDRLR